MGITGPMYKVYFAKGDEQVLQKAVSDIKAGLTIFELELNRRGTKFFGGDKPGMLDYMIWPWAERLPMIHLMAGCDDFLLPETSPKMCSWMGAMKEDPVVKAIYMTPETHMKYLKSSAFGSPDYDMEVISA